ncbi:NAD-dependent epimerase/dehydratase family protein [Elioraea rosea]|uniref:NAD-dependent epimerase/dehydratase family protein n=1 Tax=Elioraea rosea TaxID=2492390 RepID=UPI001315A442|nr:NAD(P)-dependent oxidoreductase [Elioraea rosea]
MADATLVTGASGFVGLAVTEALLARGDTVVAFDRSPVPDDAARRFARLPGRLVSVQGDVRSDADLAAVFAAAPVSRVLHAAVITAGPEREKTDAETIVAVNVLGALAVLRACLAHRVARLVSPSSVAVYGQQPEGSPPFDEETTCPKPIMLYGITKLAAEQSLARLARVHGLSFAAARLGSVFGPWERDTGLRDTLSPHLAATVAALRGGDAVLNRPTRGDHVYVRDVASGLLGLLDAPALSHDLFNLGSGVATDVAMFCAALARHRPAFRWRIAAEGEAPSVVTHVPFDRPAMRVDRLVAATGWRPRYGLHEAAADALAFFEAHPAS